MNISVWDSVFLDLIYLYMYGVYICKGKIVILYIGFFVIDYIMFCKYFLKVGYGECVLY